MSDATPSVFRPPGSRARAAGPGEDHRFRRLPAHAAVQFTDQHPDHHRLCAAAVVHRRSGAEIRAVDAVWTGNDRTACLPKNPGDVVGACWPFIQAKFPQFIYGFYPEPERWRVNLIFALAVILLVPLLIPRLPAKGPNAILFFVAFPVVAFFLLRGGGLSGFGVSWTAGLLAGFNDSIFEGGRKLVASGETTAVVGSLLWRDRQAARADEHDRLAGFCCR